MMQVINLFPTAIGSFHLGREITAEEMDFMLNQPQKSNTGNTTSENRNILEHETMTDIRVFIQQCVDKYFQEIFRPKFDVKLRFTQTWMNYSEPGQFHHKHAHPNSLISGCFYPQANPEVDKITFFDESYKRIDIHTEEFNHYNSPSWWIPVGTGSVLIFPSSLTHMVENVMSDKTRVSLAFNTFPVGYIGNDNTLTGLHL
jgi:uncharacterized protein (TIGR02466 family)